MRPLATDVVNEEGLDVAVAVGDGQPELIAGQSWYRLLPRPPTHRIYLDHGSGEFQEHDIDVGTSAHEAKPILLARQVGNAGKPYRNLRSEPARGPEVDGCEPVVAGCAIYS